MAIDKFFVAVVIVVVVVVVVVVKRKDKDLLVAPVVVDWDEKIVKEFLKQKDKEHLVMLEK